MNPFNPRKVTPIFLLCLLFVIKLTAQQQTPLDIALRYAEQEYAQWRLDKGDIANMLVSDNYRTQHNGITHLYFLQRHASIPVHNAIMSIHITADGNIGFANSRFIANLITKVNATAPVITAEQAIIYASRTLDLPGKAAPKLISKTEKGALIFEDASISQSPIIVRLMYQPLANGKVHLAWDLAIEQTNTPDYWSVRIDALNGDLLEKDNWTVYCNFDENPLHLHTAQCETENSNKLIFREVKQALQEENFWSPDNASYNVFPIPVESPIHGQRQIVTNPADAIASPFGWHDINGIDGPDYLITRGNNVHAYLDKNNTNTSKNDEPNGGNFLIFNYLFDDTKAPDSSKNASVTQLFYMNNVMHDFTYYYGFDEVAGNFQQNNYNKGGKGGDYVNAQSQDASSIEDSRYRNNANFSTLPDGQSGKMQMYIWDKSVDLDLIVQAPASIAGTYSVGQAAFGLQYSATPIGGRVVAAIDDSTAPSLACGTIINAAEVAGNIALIDRGTCKFKEKVRNAQTAGAIGVLICNNTEGTIKMGDATEVTAIINIPSFSISNSDCKLIRAKLSEGVKVVFQLPKSAQKEYLDGSFDNGVVAHEYGHGISSRLTGGPSTANCLNNDEQMGEGWSDFFALVTTAKPEDTGAKGRGIGTYVYDGVPTALGIRRYRYSTDMNINPQTYDDIVGTDDATTYRPHPVGEPWAEMLWDLYWKLVDVYGYDDDLYTGKGGNNLAIQLVIDGMKLQSCNPGYVDGRNAILAADILDNGGANQCLIWEVFARRGLGYSADQGSNDNRNDGLQAFDQAPECSKSLKIVKSATPLIEPGEEITYTITVTNYNASTVTNVTVRDVLPSGTNYIANSLTNNTTGVVQNEILTFKLDSLRAGQWETFSYKVRTTPTSRSTSLFLDEVETDTTRWTKQSVTGNAIWKLDTVLVNGNAQKVWFVENTDKANDQILRLNNTLTVVGNQPVLRFYHNYDTDPGVDGGLVQISTDNGATWLDTDTLLFRNGYRGRIASRTFNLNKQRAFWGKTNDFVESYIDLSGFIGQQISLRFRFGSAAQYLDVLSQGTGWAIDRVEMLDMFNYQSEACVTSAQGDQACAIADARGTIVQPRALTATDEPENTLTQLTLYPNPAKEEVNVAINTPLAEAAVLSIYNVEGRLLQQQSVNLIGGSQLIPVKLNNLSAGFYLLELKTQHSIATQKLIVH